MWLETDLLPTAAHTCRTRTELELSPVSIGAGVVSMASAARQHFLSSNGVETVNTLRFSGCREYLGESTIRFGETSEDRAAPGRTAAAGAMESLPADVPFAIELTEPIDTSTAAAGDPFAARLVLPLRVRGRTEAPAGSPVEGRIVRVQVNHAASAEAVVVLRPEAVVTPEGRRPLTAIRDLRREVEAARKTKVQILLPFAHERNTGLYEFPGDQVIVPKGFYSEWKTVVRR